MTMTTIEQDRRTKLDKIRALGFDPYANSGLNIIPIWLVRSEDERTKDKTKETAPVFAVSGRVLLRRGMGKLSFLTIQSAGNRIQVALDFSRLSDKHKELTKLIDLGDNIAAEGILFPTKTGE